MGLVSDLRSVARGWRWTRRPLAPRTADPNVTEPARRTVTTGWARTRPARAAREVIHRCALKPLVWAEVTPRVTGLDRLAGLTPPVVFVANHTSHLDAPLVLCSLPRRWRQRTATAAAADYFFDAWWRAASTALVFNAFSVDRGGGRMSSLPGQLLDDGWNLLLFPEGTRSRDGWVDRFRRGAALLCMRHGASVVPVAIRGAFTAMPRGRRWPAPGRPPVAVCYGRPLSPDRGESSRQFSARLEQAVAQLADEDATTWWQATRRAVAEDTPPASGPQASRWRRVWEATRPVERRDPPAVWKD